jgi:hypothetical protein
MTEESKPLTSSRSTIRPLLLLNLALLIVLGAVTFGAHSNAQQARGDYTMAAGDARGTSSGVVYIVDTRNQEMVAVSYDGVNNQFMGIAYRNLRRDMEAVRARQAPQR